MFVSSFEDFKERNSFFYLYVFYLNFPESLRAGGRGSRLPQRRPEKDVLHVFVLVTGQELLLLGMKQPHHISLTVDTYKT